MHTPGWSAPLPALLFAAVAVWYSVGVRRLHRRGDPWPRTRTASMLLGSACLVAAALPPLSAHHRPFPVHVTQHLLTTMAGPLLLALAAPVTLALRTLRRPRRALLLKVVHSRPVALVASPPLALALNVGGVGALYLTGLYQATEQHPLLHAAVHLHMLLAGCLFAWAVLGIDPVRGRASTTYRIVVLVLAGAAHDAIAKLMYARGLPIGGGTSADRELGAALMYYGGTFLHLVMAVAVMAQWYRAGARQLRRTARSRSAYGAAADA